MHVDSLNLQDVINYDRLVDGTTPGTKKMINKIKNKMKSILEEYDVYDIYYLDERVYYHNNAPIIVKFMEIMEKCVEISDKLIMVISDIIIPGYSIINYNDRYSSDNIYINKHRMNIRFFYINYTETWPPTTNFFHEDTITELISFNITFISTSIVAPPSEDGYYLNDHELLLRKDNFYNDYHNYKKIDFVIDQDVKYFNSEIMYPVITDVIYNNDIVDLYDKRLLITDDLYNWNNVDNNV